MEEIYPAGHFRASKPVPLKNYFENMNETIGMEPSDPQNKVEYFNELNKLMGMDLNLSTLKELSEACSVSQLDCPGEDTKNFPMVRKEAITSASILPSPLIQTKGHLNIHKLTVENKLNVKQVVNSIRNQMTFHRDILLATHKPNLKPGPNFMVSILIHRPFAFQYNARNTSEKLRFSHEILALGQNSLCQIRDLIMCPTDTKIRRKVENTLPDKTSAKEQYPSGFFFINDTFYNDLRAKNSIDYSTSVKDWAKRNNINGLKYESMENMTVNDLRPRFGYPYVYMHQGNCEHILVFSDANLVHHKDTQAMENFPCVSKINRYTTKLCAICTISPAAWMCMESDRLPQNKSFLCTDCCNAYNYIGGQKVGKFTLYPCFESHLSHQT